MIAKDTIETFIAKLENECNTRSEREIAWLIEHPEFAHKFTYSIGKKYAKIHSEKGGVWCFINLENGDMLKPASWSAPAKHARGNIANAEYGKNYTWTGPNYLR